MGASVAEARTLGDLLRERDSADDRLKPAHFYRLFDWRIGSYGDRFQETRRNGHFEGVLHGSGVVRRETKGKRDDLDPHVRLEVRGQH